MSKNEWIIKIFDHKSEYSGYLSGYVTEWYRPPDRIAAILVRKNRSNFPAEEGSLILVNCEYCGECMIFDNMEDYNKKMEELKKFQASE